MREFIEALFGGKAEKDFILLWEKLHGSEGGRSAWYQSIDSAVKHVSRIQDHNIYIGVGTSPQNFGTGHRCTASQISGIPGFWLDIDMKNEVHAKENLPATQEDVEKLLACIPYAPTVEIDSGHGRQFWWLFNEFWIFDNKEDRDKAAAMSRKFTVMFRDYAKTYKWGMDMTFDLSRILRVPGTMNCKTLPHVPVVMTKLTDVRYNIDDINNILPDEKYIFGRELIKESDFTAKAPAAKGEQPPPLICENFVLDKNANPPAEKMSWLQGIEPKFWASWMHKRKDFVSGKDSPSEYDMSLAIFAFQAKWTWQEVVDLLVAFRRMHALPLKTVNAADPTSPLRENYYKETLTRAQEFVFNIEQKKTTKIVNRQAAQETKESAAVRRQARLSRAAYVEAKRDETDKIIADASVMPADEKKKMLIQFLATTMDLPIKAVIAYEGDPRTYEIELEEQEVAINGEILNKPKIVSLGTIEFLQDQRLFRRRMADAGIAVKPVKKDDWWPIEFALVKSVELVTISEDMTDGGTVWNWVFSYLRGKKIEYSKDKAGNLLSPYCMHGQVHIFSTSLHEWIRDVKKDTVNHKIMVKMLFKYGFTHAKLHYKLSEGYGITSDTTINSYWLPLDDKLVAPFIDTDLVDCLKNGETG